MSGIIASGLKRVWGSSIRRLRDPWLDKLDNAVAAMTNEIDAVRRQRIADKRPLPYRRSGIGSAELRPSILQQQARWRETDPMPCEIPGMISREEAQYFQYVGQFYSGQGAALELGPWLGRSTFFILAGLSRCEAFKGRKLYVYDDFVWRASWMNDKVPAREQLENHADFRFLFDRYTRDVTSQLEVEQRKITTYDGNDEIPQLEWDRGAIEILYVDCGRTFEANDAWYKLFAPHLLPDVTLLVLQDWGTHREVPRKPYNQMKQFVESKGNALQPVHELLQGGIGTFLFRGRA